MLIESLDPENKEGRAITELVDEVLTVPCRGEEEALREDKSMSGTDLEDVNVVVVLTGEVSSQAQISRSSWNLARLFANLSLSAAP
jgi:hypothetical protein